MSMLLVHPYPNRQHYGFCELQLYGTSASIVKVTIELHGVKDLVQVEVQLHSNLNESWENYEMPYIIKLQDMCLRPKLNSIMDYAVLDNIICANKNPLYAAFGYIHRSQPIATDTICVRECTFRDRYRKVDTDIWSDWFWVFQL